MKRFISVLTFSLLFFAVKADTIGYYAAFIGKKYVQWNGQDPIQLKSDSISMKDTLTISYFSCGSSAKPGEYRLVINDSATLTYVYGANQTGERFKVPLAPLIAYKQFTGDAVFKVYSYATVGDPKTRDIFFIRLE